MKPKEKKLPKPESGIYFTRLTPNSKNWTKPSGMKGKCTNKNLYEAKNGFGWEEWLLEEYELNKNKPEHVCKGFIQAFNGKNKNRKIERLYLYTKVCKCTNPEEFVCYYVGYIENIKVTNSIARSKSEVEPLLKQVGITHNNFECMLPRAYNIKFAVKDVHLCENLFSNSINSLEKGQYRFALYNLIHHSNFKNKIKKLEKYANF